MKDVVVWQGNQAILLQWKNREKRRIVILRGAERDLAAAPEHGQALAPGDRVRNFVVIYQGRGEEFLDEGLTNGIRNWYRVYAVDDGWNYSPRRLVIATPGEGERLMDAPGSCEFPGRFSPGGYYGGYDLDLMQVEKLGLPTVLRRVAPPGMRALEVPWGAKPLVLREDGHPPVGGLATYSASILPDQAGVPNRTSTPTREGVLKKLLERTRPSER